MRLALFASGGGSNAGAILDAIDAGRLRAEPVLLVSDRPGIGALARAEARDIPTEVIAPLSDASRFAQALLNALARQEADAIALAGYLKKIPDPVVWAFRDRILNVHPSLLPAFGGAGWYGKRVHQGVLDAGCRVTGATVHLVDDEYDTGPIVLQEAVRVEPDDTPETLATRVLAVEHRLFPQALALLADGRLQVEAGRVRILPPSRPSAS
ncbi:phosphoribosylglycinamide formyltransferase [Rubrivirga marina]|uniref:Phosphoribosylglycinamide formyltransferase n=1 Tax=Rubrivirga marina TaxID=1196024 RepID=A0A271J3H1_9BACT|nr:phosphoribosylglycinamide formyltransferase [Rubrivirga marina]PAP77594.1 phosphoribosylglycinamide formyltransferase [Rubrivirga marina]